LIFKKVLYPDELLKILRGDSWDKKMIVGGNVAEIFVYEKDHVRVIIGKPSNGGRHNKASKEKTMINRAITLSRAQKNIRRIVNMNWGVNSLFLTFTFAENYSDVAGGAKLWDGFMKRLQRRYGKQNFLAVVEFQKRGALHYHAVFFDLGKVFNPSKVSDMTFRHSVESELGIIWRHGFVDVSSRNGINNVGAYLCKYMTKDNADERLLGHRGWFSSHGLPKSKEVYNEDDINRVLEKFTLISTRTYYDRVHGVCYHVVMNDKIFIDKKEKV